MNGRLGLAAVGVGRIGYFHALHVQELSRERGDCELVAVVDRYENLASQVASRLQPGQESRIHAFTSVEELLASGVADGAVIASRTDHHYGDARPLIDGGLRVLLEKPLTAPLESAREFAAYLDADPVRKNALMQAFMRRYDAPLQYARQMLQEGRIGTPFKIVSVLEDPVPPPEGYSSPGLLPDMSVHNIDEIMWLSGAEPVEVSAVGSLLYNQRITAVKEDLDDAFLQMWFPGALAGQIMVSRNHVAGYRNETWVYGDEGLIHLGGFQEDPLKVLFEAYDRSGVIEKREFVMRAYPGKVPVFLERFGPAYVAELAEYVDRCISGEPFAVDHNDGLRALIVAEAGNRSMLTQGRGVRVE